MKVKLVRALRSIQAADTVSLFVPGSGDTPILYFLYTDEARKIYYRDGRSRIRGPGSYGIGAACVYVR